MHTMLWRFRRPSEGGALIHILIGGPIEQTLVPLRALLAGR